MINHKRSVLLGLAATLAIAAAPGRSQAQCSGDPNGGGITGADVSIVLVCINNPANAVCGASCGGDGILDCADVNLDGALTISDAVQIANEASGAPCPLNPVPICSNAGTQLPCNTVISDEITANTTLGACEYELDGTIFVQPGVVVTIRPGATIKGRAVSGDGTPSALVFLQGNCAALGGDNQPSAGDAYSARINAVGTANLPIIFTSDQPVGEKASGQWAGIVFNGCSQTNVPGGVGTSEGFSAAVNFGGGGVNNILAESSGVARYVRAEFAGRELAPNNELNVWTMNSLGSCTDFSFIQAHGGADDGFEWFGGTNNMRNIVATANRDDNFDWQLGSAIKVQFGVIQQTAGNVDTAGSNGFEGDNNETTNTLTPYSDPRICNVTAIGDTTATGGTNLGMLLRRGTAGRIAKSIFHCWDDGGMRLDQTATAVHACDAPPSPFTLAFQTGPQLLVEASIFGENDTTAGNSPIDCGNNGSTGAECNSTDFCGLLQSVLAFPNGLGDGVMATARNSSINAAITIPCTYGQIDPAPSTASQAANSFDCNSGFGGDAFFVGTNYAGAVDPNAPSWLDTPGGWINFDLN